MLTHIANGVRAMASSPGLLLWLWLANLVAALPAGLLIEESIHRSVANSRTADSLRAGFDNAWFEEFQSAGEGLTATLSPSHVGVGAWLDNLDSWWTGGVFGQPPEILLFAGIFGLLWLLLLGGVLERLRSPARPFSSRDLFTTGGRYFFRLLRIALLTAVAYYGAFRLARWLFDWIGSATIDATAEKTVLIYNLLAAALVVGLLLLIRTVSDVAKIATIVEDRRSALLAVGRGIGFVATHPVAIAGIIAVFSALTGVLFVLYKFLAPGVTESSAWGIVAALVITQLFLVAKVALRIALLGSETALYTNEYRG